MLKNKKTNFAKTQLLEAFQSHNTAMIDAVLTSAQLRKSVKINTVNNELNLNGAINFLDLIKGPFALENISYLFNNYSHQIEQISRDDTIGKIIMHASLQRKIEIINYAFNCIESINTSADSYWFEIIHKSMRILIRTDGVECFKILDEKINLDSWVSKKNCANLSFKEIILMVNLYESNNIAQYISLNIERIEALNVEKMLDDDIKKNNHMRDYNKNFIPNFLNQIALCREKKLLEKNVPKAPPVTNAYKI